ncbi:hypothetical protein SSPS47_09530 [Streptomyces sp. S4.7]|nr:hypothetical protein SSPS47_09530 [Streptomyces sp. S4.7]
MALAITHHHLELHAAVSLALLVGLSPGTISRLNVRDWAPGRAPQLTIRGTCARTIRVARSAAAALGTYLGDEPTTPYEPLVLGLHERGWIEGVFGDHAQRAGLRVSVFDLRRLAVATVLAAGIPQLHAEAYFNLPAADGTPRSSVEHGYDMEVARVLESQFGC